MNFLIIIAAKYLYIFIGFIAVISFFISSKQVRANILKLSLLAFPLILIVAKILNHIINSPRPFIVDRHIQPLIHASSDNGFPSDHTLLAMSIASVVFAFDKKWGVILVILAVLVGVGRVLAQVHHPLDIVGSVIIAVVTTHISWHILRKCKQI